MRKEVERAWNNDTIQVVTSKAYYVILTFPPSFPRGILIVRMTFLNWALALSGSALLGSRVFFEKKALMTNTQPNLTTTLFLPHTSAMYPATSGESAVNQVP